MAAAAAARGAGGGKAAGAMAACPTPNRGTTHTQIAATQLTLRPRGQEIWARPAWHSRGPKVRGPTVLPTRIQLTLWTQLGSSKGSNRGVAAPGRSPRFRTTGVADGEAAGAQLMQPTRTL